MTWNAEKLKTLRKAYGETQAEFAARVGVNLFTVGNWERGRPIPALACKYLDRLEEDLKEGKIRELQPA